MGTLVLDAGSRYIVKDENLVSAYAWLVDEGEYAFFVGKGPGVTILGANSCEEMFCGNVSYGFTDSVREFMESFCEDGSYACFKYPDDLTYGFCWKAKGVVSWDFEEWDNPFRKRMAEMERAMAWS